jgi:predicted O-methyltransferase YrrM
VASIADGTIRLYGTQEDIFNRIVVECPDALTAFEKSARIKGHIFPHQAVALYALARQYDGGEMLEIGTLHGYSASLLAQGAPAAHVVTLNNNADEAKVARVNLADYPGVEVIEAVSWEYLAEYDGPHLDLVFVDGDHNRVARDLPWWHWLKPDGLMLFHDYSPATAAHPSPIVYDTVRGFADGLHRELDVEIIDSLLDGLAGLYKRDLE